MSIVIRPGGLDDLQVLLTDVPELQIPFDRDAAQDRLAQQGLVLVAAIDDQDVGFKAGYDRYGDGSFYSWLGGVFPAARRHGVAQALMDAQHRTAQQRGYTGIYVKTRNRYVGMRILLARNGYQVCGFDPGGAEGKDLGEARLLHYFRL
ncbi:MAG: GNAT family N-acetyltransferase [Pseudomonadota bacterium]